jgi:hypothetical protein
MRNPTHCEFSVHDFRATAIETSSGRLIHVSGSGLCPSAGWELRLAPANSGVVPHPETLTLELRESPRHGSARVLTKTLVEAIIEDPRAEQVAIRFGWREGFVLPVRARPPARSPRPRVDERGERSDAASDRVEASAV